MKFTYLALFLLFCSCVATQQGTTDKRFKGRYAAQLERGEEEIWSTYQEVAARRADGTYVRRMFFPETYKMTSFQTFSDVKLQTAEGPFRSYSDQGDLRQSGQYADDERTGTWSTYRPETGTLLEQGNYVSGKRDGEWVDFDSSSRKTNTTKYIAGNVVRKMTYDTNGVLLSDFRYDGDEIVEVLAGEKPDESKQLERMPLYAGCGEYTNANYDEVKRCADRKMLEFIYGSIRYPARARNNGVQGMGVVSFVIEKDGSINELKVVRGLNEDISREMVRVVSLMPDWIPGRVGEEDVRVQFNLPVKFKLE